LQPMRATVCAGLVLALCGLAIARTAADDKITNLPGWNGTFNQYAGYVTVDESHGRNLFYWFVEAQTNPETAPLVLWLNGGPGCSSVAGGLFSELGPWYPNANGSLTPNPYSWNTLANVVFLESPAGVGFSFSDDASDYTVGDNRTAADSYAFLQGFLARYPQYAKSPFWISGESYGGHYVPGLAQEIVLGNQAAPKTGNLVINLKGFLVGNAWTVAEYDNFGAIAFWLSHGMISVDAYNAILDNCNLSSVGPLAAMRPEVNLFRTGGGLAADDDDGPACNNAVNLAFAQQGNINIYDIYADVCTDSGKPKRRLAGADYPSGGVKGYDPCIDDKTTAYLNRLDVQQAIHANTTLPWKWSECSSVVNYSRADLLSSMFPVYEFLLQSNIKILVFSGDVDAIVPVTGTMTWLNKLGKPIVKAKRAWYVNDQVGGRVTEYQGLTFSTVRNAGHMVPYTQPDRALYMFTQWINGQEF